MADITIVNGPDITYVYIALFAFFIYRMIWNRLGGSPEAWYRIRKIPYFFHYTFGEDHSYDRCVHPWSIVEHHSPAMFTCKRGKYVVQDGAMARERGKPALYYNVNEAEPIQIFSWKKGGQIDPALVQSAFENKTVEEMHRLGQGTDMRPWLILGIGLIIAIVVAGVAAYYGYDAHCALKPAACGGFKP